MTGRRAPHRLVQDSPVDPEFVFIVNYACPRCHASLEARASDSTVWLRCPACGRASLPPDHNRASTLPIINDETLMIGTFANGDATVAPLPIRSSEMASWRAREASRTPAYRLFLGSGLMLSFILFVVALLDSNGGRAGFFGLIGIACIILLIRTAGRSSGD